jgi:hypothetical protein
MFARLRSLRFALALLAACASAGAADAGWVTFKNDTGKPIVVQEFIVVNGKKVGGKPYKLLAGESFREFQNTPGVKNFDVLDASNPNLPLWSNPLNCRADSQSFSVGVVQGKVFVKQVPDAKRP